MQLFPLLIIYLSAIVYSLLSLSNLFFGFFLYFSIPNLVFSSSKTTFIFSFLFRISFVLNISLFIKFKKITQLQNLFSPNSNLIDLLYLSNIEFERISSGNLL